MYKVGFVIIGRNEGERLKRCIKSILRYDVPAVYVDSNSTDESVEYAKSKNLDVVELDLSIPFTAGRARNEGFQWLIQNRPDIEYVHFIDGDCQLAESWLDNAVSFLELNYEVAIVCGVRNETSPDASIFNFLCHLEWDGPKGKVAECGGDFLIRTQVMQTAGGFDPTYIAGEEPELCFRIRQLGWAVYRLDQKMTIHDANITKLSQWWYRAQRSGHAYAQVAYFHGRTPEKIYVKPTISNLAWGSLFPLMLLISLFLNPFIAVLLLAIFIFKIVRLSLGVRKIRNLDWVHSLAYGMDIMLGKIPHAVGTFQFFIRHLVKAKFTIIEYK